MEFAIFRYLSKTFWILFFFTQLVNYGDANRLETLEKNSTISENNRDEKFLSLFSIVRFPNSICAGTNSYNGTCLTSAECTSYGGTASGTCASGFGVCCIVTIQTCGTTTSLNNTYWQNSGYSSAYTTAGQCSLYVNKNSADIAQLRLDFYAFTLASPETTVASTTIGQCSTDSFTVSGASNPVPAICGVNTNQHVYIDIGPGTNTITFNIITSGTVTSRFWNIRISQIPGNTDYTAPNNCLQWYTEAAGTVKSFNFQAAAAPVVQHLAYQDYTICIRTNQGFCGVSYAVCSAAYPSFGISTDAAAAEATTTVLDANCAFDFLAIPCASDQMNSVSTVAGASVGCASKICGIFFSAAADGAADKTLFSYRRPFELRFYTDANEQVTAADTKESYGFCLTYAQQPCLSISTSTG